MDRAPALALDAPPRPLRASFGVPWYARLWGLVVALVGSVALGWFLGLDAPYRLEGVCEVTAGERGGEGEGARVRCALRPVAMARAWPLVHLRFERVSAATTATRSAGKSVRHVVLLRGADGAARGELATPELATATFHTRDAATALAAQLGRCLPAATAPDCAALPVREEGGRPWFVLLFGAWMTALGLSLASYHRGAVLDPRTGALRIVRWGPLPLHRRVARYALPPGAVLRASPATRTTQARLVLEGPEGHSAVLLEALGQHDEALRAFAQQATAALARAPGARAPHQAGNERG